MSNDRPNISDIYCPACHGYHNFDTKICPKTNKRIEPWEDLEGKWKFRTKFAALLLAAAAVGAFFYFGGGTLLIAGLQRAAVAVGLGAAGPALVGAEPEKQCPDYKVREDGCLEGFYLSTGGQGTGACEQEVCPPNSHRNYTLECLCNDGFHPVSDPCRSALLKECRP